MKESDLLDMEVFIHAETEKAIRVSNEVCDPVWLPLSQIEINHRHGQSGEITLPRWLAEQRGLA